MWLDLEENPFQGADTENVLQAWMNFSFLVFLCITCKTISQRKTALKNQQMADWSTCKHTSTASLSTTVPISHLRALTESMHKTWFGLQNVTQWSLDETVSQWDNQMDCFNTPKFLCTLLCIVSVNLCTVYHNNASMCYATLHNILQPGLQYKCRHRK